MKTKFSRNRVADIKGDEIMSQKDFIIMSISLSENI